MKRIIRNFIYLVLLLSLPSVCIAGDFVVGKIIELSPDRELIQVMDTVYKIKDVFHDDGVNPVNLVPRKDLTEGSVVQIYPGTKTVDFCYASKVVLLTGLKEKQMFSEFGTEYHPFQTLRKSGRSDD